jgi:hypothetical protein
MTVRSRKWDHSLGHDGLTAEHNSLVTAADALAAVLQGVEKSAAISGHQRDEIRAVLVTYFGPTSFGLEQ